MPAFIQEKDFANGIDKPYKKRKQQQQQKQKKKQQHKQKHKHSPYPDVMSLKSLFKPFLPRITYFFYRLLLASWRVEISFDPKAKDCFKKNQRFLLALWHQDILPVLSTSQFVKPCIALVSPSPHGTLLEYTLSQSGLIAVRGSARTLARASSKELIRRAKLHQANVAFAVDGPSGPRHEVKPGIFTLSYLLGYPILHIRIKARRKYILKKLWDKPYIPLPFSRIFIRFEWAFQKLTKEECRDTNLPRQLKRKMLLESS